MTKKELYGQRNKLLEQRDELLAALQTLVSIRTGQGTAVDLHKAYTTALEAIANTTEQE